MNSHVVNQDYITSTLGLLEFIRKSPTSYQAVECMRQQFDTAGFIFLPEQEPWRMQRGGCYYTIRNGSSIMAFRVGAELEYPAFRIAASHADSPSFKVKAIPDLEGPAGYLRVNTEVYGGAIDRTWLDRPLSVAGRVMVRDDSGVRSQLVSVDKDLLLIPSVAIHMNRSVNESGAIDRHIDLYPILSAGTEGKGALKRVVANELGVTPNQICAWDLYVVNRQPGVIWGAQREFVSSARLDDLQCAYASCTALLGPCDPHAICVHACFDNEEVGSGTMQGALSTFLPDVLTRVCDALGMDAETRRSAVARSFMVSCDNAHAVHPNHPELCDPTNQVRLNGGVVIKEAASQRYATDAMSRSLFQELCMRADVPTQAYANRSDMPGGSTLGNLAMRQASMHTVDVGLPQLAMHSAYETAGTRDTAHMVSALSAFFGERFDIAPNDEIRFF